MLASFWKTFGESIWVTTRSWSASRLSSRLESCTTEHALRCRSAATNWLVLRVLGYTRAEIGRILLGEQGLLTLTAIPCGFALGFGLSVLLSRFFSRELFRLPLGRERRDLCFCRAHCRAAALSRAGRGRTFAPHGFDRGIEVAGVRASYETNHQTGFHGVDRSGSGDSVAIAFRPKPIQVETARAVRGPCKSPSTKTAKHAPMTVLPLRRRSPAVCRESSFTKETRSAPIPFWPPSAHCRWTRGKSPKFVLASNPLRLANAKPTSYWPDGKATMHKPRANWIARAAGPGPAGRATSIGAGRK